MPTLLSVFLFHFLGILVKRCALVGEMNAVVVHLFSAGQLVEVNPITENSEVH
jgi:TRAP-type mannitol/chloroaromatic compound transport system permease large subunit